jgi:hypothetical protein
LLTSFHEPITTDEGFYTRYRAYHHWRGFLHQIPSLSPLTRVSTPDTEPITTDEVFYTRYRAYHHWRVFLHQIPTSSVKVFKKNICTDDKTTSTPPVKHLSKELKFMYSQVYGMWGLDKTIHYDIELTNKYDIPLRIHF